MPQKKMNRNQRAKTIVGALGGGKRARKGTAKGITTVRKGIKAAAGAVKQISKSKMGREQRKRIMG
jgi:hypothetical protein